MVTHSTVFYYLPLFWALGGQLDQMNTGEVRRKTSFDLFPLTLADACLLVEVVACGALTLEATEGVDTVATLAQAWQLLALINVWWGQWEKESGLVCWDILLINTTG